MKLKLALIALLMAAGAVNAAPLEWNLEGVTYNDGTRATGYFIYDASVNNLSKWSVTLSGSAKDDPFTFNNSNTDWAPFNSGPNPSMALQEEVAGTQVEPWRRRLLELSFAGELTNAGGTIPIGVGSTEHLYGTLASLGCPEYSCNGYTRLVTAGDITAAVPEPETYAMMLAGLGLLGFAARRRKLKEAAVA